eukprot:scaffold978_cov164-Amphora_coffeaeformis.AAC.6
MPSDAELLDALERLLSEVEALQVIYGEAFCITNDAGLLAALQQTVAQQRLPDNGIPTLQGRLELPSESTSSSQQGQQQLSLTFPPGYPEYAAVRVFASVGSTTCLQKRADALVGQEAVMDLVQAYQDMIEQEQQNDASQEREITTLSPPAHTTRRITAVVEFHHMLIGSAHKKEATALKAAATHGVQGFIFMGGVPSMAIVHVTDSADLTAWLSDCRKAGKEGTCVYWRTEDEPHDFWKNVSSNNKLKIVNYATGKDTKVDTVAYKESLAKLDVSFPLPPCEPWL